MDSVEPFFRWLHEQGSENLSMSLSMSKQLWYQPNRIGGGMLLNLLVKIIGGRDFECEFTRWQNSLMSFPTDILSYEIPDVLREILLSPSIGRYVRSLGMRDSVDYVDYKPFRTHSVLTLLVPWLPNLNNLSMIWDAGG